MQIKIYKIPGAFMATNESGQSGVGNTWPEAIGALVAIAPAEFGVDGIEYATDGTTVSYVVERGLDRKIV